jgi:nickel/cobalt transporter (NicO) family protein
VTSPDVDRGLRAERVYPWLGLVSGLIAFALGASLQVARLGSWSGRRVGPDHHYANAAGTAGHEHVRLVPAPAEVLSRRSLTALAVAGGLLPSPTALVVLLAAVALHRIAYGLALIGVFSLGLATSLVVVGLVALRARDAVAGSMSGRTASLVPVLSAASIALLGLVLTCRRFAQI